MCRSGEEGDELIAHGPDLLSKEIIMGRCLSVCLYVCLSVCLCVCLSAPHDDSWPTPIIGPEVEPEPGEVRGLLHLSDQNSPRTGD